MQVVGSLSTTTFYSGSTNLYSIFAPIGVTGGTGGSGTFVGNGINTFTAGTTSLQSVNITSATLNNLSTSGTNNNYRLSSTTISAGTIYSGSSELTSVLDPRYRVSEEIIGTKLVDNFNRGTIGPNWTVAGTTGWTITSNQLVAPSGTGINDVLYYNPYTTLLYQNNISASFIVGTVNTPGLALGFLSSVNLFIQLDTTNSSASYIRFYINSSEVRPTSTSNPEIISMSSGDTYTMNIYINKYNYKVVVTKSTGESISSMFEIDFADFVAAPKVGNIAIAAFGGSGHKCTLINSSDKSIKYFKLKILGDSIVWGTGPFVQEECWSEKLSQAYIGVSKFCAPGLSLTNITAAVLAELQSQFIPNIGMRILIQLGINDLLTLGRTPTQVNNDTDAIKATLEGYGYIVDLATLLPNASVQSSIDIVNAYRRSQSTTNKIIDFAKTITTSQLSDSLHPSAAGTINLTNLSITSYENILNRNSYLKDNFFEQDPKFKIIAIASASLSANISSTDTSMLVSNISGFYSNAYYQISNGTAAGTEIIYVDSVVDGKIFNIKRAQLGTAAITVSATPSNYVVNLITDLNMTNVLPICYRTTDGSYRSKHFWNCAGPLLSNEEIYRFSLQDTSTGRFVVDGIANIAFCLNKASSTNSTQLLFGDNSNYRYTITHSSSNILSIGRFSGGVPNITIGPSDNMGIFTTNYLYRTTNIGSDLSSRFVIDINNSVTTGYSWVFTTTGEFGLASANNTRRILGAQFRAENVSTFAGSETMDLGVYTQQSGTTLAIRAKFGSYGIQFPTAGQGIQIKSGINARVGTVILTAGTATILNTGFTSNTKVKMDLAVFGGTIGSAYIYSGVPGSSFTINSITSTGTVQATDTSTIDWMLIEHI